MALISHTVIEAITYKFKIQILFTKCKNNAPVVVFLYLLIGPFTQALIHHDRKCAFVLRKLIMDMSSNYAALEVGLWSFTLCNAL